MPSTPLPCAALELLRAGLTAEALAVQLHVELARAQEWRSLYLAGRLDEARRRQTLRRWGAVTIAVGAVMLLGRTAMSQGLCTQTLPYGLVTMCPDLPAMASEVNGNAALLGNWVNAKVGPPGSTTINATAIESSGALTINTSSTAAVRFGGAIAVANSITLGDSSATCAAGTAGALRWRPTGLEHCNGASWVRLSVAGTSLVSCATLRAANPALPNGHYALAAGGYLFSADCDMSNGGWTMVQAHSATQRTVESLGVSSYSGNTLPASVARALANASSQMRVETNGGSASSTANGPAIQALRALNAAQEPATGWTASGTFNVGIFNASCGTTGRYPDTYHACGNSTGLHILGDTHALNNSPNSNINIWVR